MGTYGIIRELHGYWKSRAHPIYVLEGRRMNSTSWYRRFTRTRFGKTGLPILIVAMAMISVIWRPFGLIAQSLGFLLCFGVALIVLYLWPVIVGVTASRVIIAEREGQTWDTLLTTPYDWGDLLLVKLASLLRNRKPGVYVMIWTLTTLVHFLLNICAWNGDCSAQHFAVEPALMIKSVVLVCLLAVTGYQLYVLSVLGGVLASLVAGSTSSASTAAGVITLGMAIFVQLGIVFVQQAFGSLQYGFTRPSPPDQLITGCIILGILMLISEFVIRRAFTALTRHLSDAAISPWENLQQNIQTDL